MSSNDEVSDYLRTLIDHQKDCTLVNCRACLALERICGLVSERIFCSSVYPEMFRYDNGNAQRLEFGAQ